MSRRRLNRITVLILIIGLGVALTIWFTNRPAQVDPFADNPQATKMYERQMKMIGGEASVMTTDFQNWLTSLWHGRSLAVTLAVLTIAIALLFRYIGSHPDFSENEGGGGDQLIPPHPR